MKAYQKAMASLRESKNLDTIMTGSSFMDEGTYQFTIQAVDTSALDADNKVGITFVTPAGQTFTDNPFVTTKDGKGIGEGFRKIIAACFDDGEALFKFTDAIAVDEQAFGILSGMKLQVTLKRSDGFRIHALAAGGFAAFTGPDNTSMQLTDPYDDVKSVREDAKGKGHKASYVNVSHTKATHAAENVAALNKALGGGAKPAPVRRAI